MSSIFTVHRQPYGEVMNPISPDSVRFHDKNGNVTEVRMVDGMVNIHVGGVTVSAEHLEDLIRPPSAPVGDSLLQPAADSRICRVCDGGPGNDGSCLCGHRRWEQPAAVEGLLTCYQCGKTVTWLAPDSRCGNCTRLTPDEVRG